MKKGLFSFIMPAYKADFIRESIDSILSQSYSEFELIVLNDASPDALEDIICKYNDSRIRYYVNEENIGGKDLVAQWNKCLSFARNEFVVLASDDDIYDEDFLCHMAKLIEKYPKVDAFHSRVQIVDTYNQIIDYSEACAEWESCEEIIWHRICKKRAQYIPEFVFRRQALMDNGGFVKFPSAWGSDHATAFLLAKEQGVVCCNKPLFKWRYSGINISSSGKHVENKVKGLTQYHAWIDEFINGFGESFYKTLIKNGLDKYLQKRIVVLLSQYSFLELFWMIINPFLNYQHYKRRHVLYGFVYKVKERVFFYAK
mgnify:CR=1 FL=1